MHRVKVLLLAAGLILSSTQFALAHAELIRSFPVANSALTKAPKYVQLEFSEALTKLKSKSANSIMIQDAKSRQITTSQISIKKGVARVEVPGQLSSGKYTIKYRVVSIDGHVLNSQFQFTVR